MKDVLGAFNQLQKAYRKYCYQAVAPLGIKMSEMLCILYLYNFPKENTAHAIAQYSQLSPGMVSKSLESLREAGYVRSQKDEQDNRILSPSSDGEGAGAGKTTACRTKLFYQ